MIFNIFEYYEEECIQEQYNDICFICFEYEIENEIKPINLGNQCFYIKDCVCNGSVHQYCLRKWFDKNKTCPICRIKVIENNKATTIVYHYIPYGLYVYDLCKNIIIVSFKGLCTIVFLYALIDLYVNIITTSYTYKSSGVNVFVIDDIY